METTLKTTAALATASSIFLSGCASTKDGRLTQAQGAGMGAILGGLAGAALGAATGNASLARDYALRGAAIGAAAGFAYGSNIAEKKAQYAKTEDFLDYAIAEADKMNSEAKDYNDRLAANVEALESKASALAAASKADKKKHLAAINKEKTNCDNQMKKLDAQIADLGECGDASVPAKNAVLSEKKSALEAEKGRLIRNQQVLAQASARMAI